MNICKKCKHRQTGRYGVINVYQIHILNILKDILFQGVFARSTFTKSTVSVVYLYVTTVDPRVFHRNICF